MHEQHDVVVRDPLRHRRADALAQVESHSLSDEGRMRNQTDLNIEPKGGG